MERIIDLSIFASKGSLVFLGRDNGQQAKARSNLVKYLNSDDNIIIIIPNQFYSICPSFYEEFLGEAKEKYKKDKKKYITIQSDNKSILNTLNQFIYGSDYINS